VCRLGDTYPSQMLTVQAHMWVYRYKPHTTIENEVVPYEV
jgi:hypothetical protein